MWSSLILDLLEEMDQGTHLGEGRLCNSDVGSEGDSSELHWWRGEVRRLVGVG